jgi:hypothetical protein
VAARERVACPTERPVPLRYHGFQNETAPAKVAIMLSKKTETHVASPADPLETRYLLADLEAAQRRDIYAAGRGDGLDRSRRRRFKLALRRP